MTARTRRNSPRQIGALQLGTALATTLFAGMLGTSARAQDILPTFGPAANPTVNMPGGATIGAGTPTPTNGASLDVNLNNANRVVNWDTFSVGTNNAVQFTTADAMGQYAVLNRVVVLGTPGAPNVSNINGAVTGQSNIVVWLSNPNGILVGPTGSFNTGGLVLTTAGISDADFLTNPVNAASGGAFSLTGGSGSITIGGTLTTNGTSGLVGTLLLAAPKITVTGSATASGSAALVAATNANFSVGIGSPLSVTITAGSAVGGALIDIDDNGGASPSISGSSVALIGASDATVMTSLLNVDAGAMAGMSSTLT